MLFECLDSFPSAEVLGEHRQGKSIEHGHEADRCGSRFNSDLRSALGLRLREEFSNEAYSPMLHLSGLETVKAAIGYRSDMKTEEQQCESPAFFVDRETSLAECRQYLLDSSYRDLSFSSNIAKGHRPQPLSAR